MKFLIVVLFFLILTIYLNKRRIAKEENYKKILSLSKIVGSSSDLIEPFWGITGKDLIDSMSLYQIKGCYNSVIAYYRRIINNGTLKDVGDYISHLAYINDHAKEDYLKFLFHQTILEKVSICRLADLMAKGIISQAKTEKNVLIKDFNKIGLDYIWFVLVQSETIGEGYDINYFLSELDERLKFYSAGEPAKIENQIKIIYLNLLGR